MVATKTLLLKHYYRRQGSVWAFVVAFFVALIQESPRQTKPKEGQFMNFSQGHSGTKVQCKSCLFSEGKTPEFMKIGKIHELFVLPLSLVWFAGATPDSFWANFTYSPLQPLKTL